MTYSLHRAFEAYVTYCEHFRDLEHFRKGADVIRKGLPDIDKSEPGWRDIMEVKNFVEWVLTEEDQLVEHVCQDDGVSTLHALTSASKEIEMENSDEIKEKIFMK